MSKKSCFIKAKIKFHKGLIKDLKISFIFSRANELIKSENQADAMRIAYAEAEELGLCKKMRQHEK